MAVDYAAVILAGGTAVRMDGVDKAGVEYAGRTLLEHALAAVAGAVEVVVVGEPVPTSRPVTFVMEDPPRGGPAAAVLAGRDALLAAPPYVAVLAVDMPGSAGSPSSGFWPPHGVATARSSSIASGRRRWRGCWT